MFLNVRSIAFLNQQIKTQMKVTKVSPAFIIMSQFKKVLLSCQKHVENWWMFCFSGSRRKNEWSESDNNLLKVEVVRCKGFLPASRGFISPDGKNRIFCFSELDALEINRFLEMPQKIVFVSFLHPSEQVRRLFWTFTDVLIMHHSSYSSPLFLFFSKMFQNF